MFEIKNVTKQFEDEYALRDVSMTISKGLNFIIGSSGSGKTTLLKIICGMEQHFDGQVFYCEQDVKTLTQQEKSYYYNNIFGFVWQDFNLLDHLTVLENIMLPQFIKPETDKKAVMRVLRELKISELAHQKTGNLSGGQKQRVAIARELIKNPQVIIADEPTSALDEKSAKTTMDILRDISKNRTVIIVTHDTSLIDQRSNVYELDKGDLIKSHNLSAPKAGKLPKKSAHKLSFLNSFTLATKNSISQLGRSITSALSLVIASVLLLVTVSGAITNSSQSAFQELFDTYGKSILDIAVVGSFISAGGTSGQENDKPTADVDQDIDGLYENYIKDDRVEFIVFTQPYNDIKITFEGKEFDITKSNNVPVINQLVIGKMPMGTDNEIVIPNSFLEQLGMTAEEVIGKTIDFSGSITNWDSGEPIGMPANTTATIVGVMDTTVTYEYEGKMYEYTVDDAFFFSKSALMDMRKQANLNGGEGNFSIRTKSPEDLISVKDELNAKGIVPLGRFELVEDMVRLNDQTKQQSGSAIFVIGLLSIVAVLAVAMMTSLTRKREYAIFKVSGFANFHLFLIAASEALLLSIGSSILFLCFCPITNIATIAFWNVDILSVTLLATGVLLVFGMGILLCAITAIISITTKASTSLKTGDH